MWLTKLFAAVMAILAGLVPSSCSSSKNPTAQQHAPPAAVASAMPATPAAPAESQNKKNLGELQLTNHYETCVNLGAGKSCIIKPTQLDHSNLQLTVALESKNTAGGVKNFSVVQITAKSGEPFEMAVGGMNLTLTPILAEK